VTAWRRGKLIFDAQPLAAVVKELNLYRSGRIFILNPELSKLKVTGVFDITDMDGALEIMKKTLPIRAINATPYLVLLR
jgi:transmembrane sensor